MSDGKTSSTKRGRLGVLPAALTACVFASAGTAIAADSSCADFGRPVDASQLDETKLGVILWDEYRPPAPARRQRQHVANAPAIMNASVSGAVTSVH